MKKKQVKNKTTRSRWWTCILYPESCKENFREMLNQKNIDWICSPLHDKDINEIDNEKKKAHYHLLFRIYKNGPSYENQANEISSELGGTISQPVRDITNAVKYLIHLNDPNKYQYDKKDITHSNCIDISDIITLSKSEEREISIAIFNFIRNNTICFYDDLLDYCIKNNIEWYDYIQKHIYHFTMICISINAKLRELKKLDIQDKMC